MSHRLEPLAEGLWAVSAPQRFAGMELGARSTILRLSDGKVLVHSPVALEEGLKAEVDALGPVASLVAPNCFHHLYFADWAAAYPDAERWGPKGLTKKRSDLDFTHLLSEARPTWAGEFEPLAIPKNPGLEEHVFWHNSSRTLVVSDFLQNYPQLPSGWWPRLYMRLTGISGQPGVSRVIRIGMRDREGTRMLVEDLVARNPERIVLAHGEIVREDAGAVLRSAYAWL